MAKASITSYNAPQSRGRGKGRGGGRGWFETKKYMPSVDRKVAPLHRKAALKGLGSSGRYGSITSAQVSRKMEGRSKRSQLIDRSRQAKHVGSIKKQKDRTAWAKHPQTMDLQSVDTRIAEEQYQARFSKRLLKEKHQQRRKLAKQIRKKKERVKRVEKPTEQKEIKEEIKETEEQKEQVEQDIKDISVKHRKVKKSIHQQKTERDDVKYAMKTMECNNYIEANALVERVRNKGIDPDKVDWDRIQGKDLVYEDRVRKLEKMVGKTYTDEEFYSSSYERKYDEMYKDWATREGYSV